MSVIGIKPKYIGTMMCAYDSYDAGKYIKYASVSLNFYYTVCSKAEIFWWKGDYEVPYFHW